jgi:hypothetical protein
MKVKTKKSKPNEFELTFVMDKENIEIRLESTTEKIESIEKSIEHYNRQLTLLKEEKEQIENILFKNV